MTDPKGDGSLSPHGQEDPDMYLRVVKALSPKDHDSKDFKYGRKEGVSQETF